LLWEMHYFDSGDAARRDWLLRVLPPLTTDAATNQRDPDDAVTILGLVLYATVVAGVLFLLDIE